MIDYWINKLAIYRQSLSCIEILKIEIKSKIHISLLKVRSIKVEERSVKRFRDFVSVVATCKQNSEKSYQAVTTGQ